MVEMWKRGKWDQYIRGKKCTQFKPKGRQVPPFITSKSTKIQEGKKEQTRIRVENYTTIAFADTLRKT